MTLILTALCKNGICVCADRKDRTWVRGRQVDTNNLKKIFRFKSKPIIIFNHGVNKFEGKSWFDLCSEYEVTNSWRGKRLEDVALDFKDFIEDSVLKQLAQNARDFPDYEAVTKAAFAICGMDEQSGRYEFHELFWSPKYMFSSWVDTRLLGSGGGYKKYLENYLQQSVRLNSSAWWGSLDTSQAKEELKRLFYVAVSTQKRAGGDDFSENYDIECVTQV